MRRRLVAVGLGFVLGLVGLALGGFRLDLPVGLALLALLGATSVPIGGRHPGWALAGLLAGIVATIPLSLAIGTILFLGEGWEIAMILALGTAVVGHVAARAVIGAVRGASRAAP